MNSRPALRPPARGFTLLEMLVVLMIAGMALALTTQALGQFRRAHERSSVNEQAGREYRLSEAWFRDSVRALTAVPDQRLPGAAVDHGSEAPVFEGRADGFTGLTLSPVLSGQGVPVAQSWEVTTGPAGTDVLELLEQERRIQLSLPGSGGLRLHYLDGTGKLHDQWPPSQGVWPQLPAAIVLEVAPDPIGARDGLAIAVAIMGPHQPLVLPYETEPF